MISNTNKRRSSVLKNMFFPFFYITQTANGIKDMSFFLSLLKEMPLQAQNNSATKLLTTQEWEPLS